jgi:hypothetical protein
VLHFAASVLLSRSSSISELKNLALFEQVLSEAALAGHCYKTASAASLQPSSCRLTSVQHFFTQARHEPKI